MALVVYDRVQETTATTGTGTITLGGAVAGYQSFAVVGNGNTTFYCIVNNSAWEVGIGTYSTTGPTLARTTILSNSNGNTTPINLSGASNVFVTYPSEKSVNLDASGNVSALGTISSGTWQGSTVGVAYGGTGVTTSSGANSVVLRDANQNVTANNFLAGYNVITAAAGTTVLTNASAYYQRISGSTTQTIQLPNATTMVNGQGFTFDNDSSGTVTIVDNASATIDTVPSGAYSYIFVEDNTTSAGSWGKYALIPASYDFSTSTANFGGATITNATYNGTTIASGYGGTGLTTFTAANNALYSTSSSALTAGTLPVAAGGTGATTLTGYVYGNGTSAMTASTTIPSSAISGTISVTNALTMNNSGTGAVSGTTFNGSSAQTISYNTVGAAPAAGSTSITTLGTIGTGTWNANAIATTYGGTGLTTFTAANNAIYSTSSSALTAGTLPVAAGGTGLTSTPANGALDIGNGTGFTRTTLTAGAGITITNGAGSISIAASVTSPIPAGTVMLFYQSAAPTGWTQVTTLNDYDLRLVSGAGGTTGGTTAYSTVFTNQTVSTTVSISGTTGATTLSTAQMPSHAHGNTFQIYWAAGNPFAANTTWGYDYSHVTDSQGGGGSHSHSFSGSGSGTSSAVTLNVRYANIIICSKN